ncbi:PDR/VanB family oxidoreductase [Calidifontimicrobium sp. SYSU G02091]|uniref:PDR/VanB family oxidoreductase n=1 Tax=Calidifontimicrobium sp. SYSU G02091 TaxID=2926421 RepID=UPI001F53B198|nr:PDR/VanB family oxidoreductase [Calidifontimicrobium sp. SYSU G02091]MCI1193249.1 PDR/VanB family oxidoreductase [Calidifontimicrobium sp. SYSU G02091]
MGASDTLQAWVHTLRHEADDIISIELRPVGGGEFPAFEAGAHIDLHLPNGMVRSYSLVNPSSERHRYVVGVLRDRKSRGGSRCVHEQLRVGTRLAIGAPRNNFPLHEDASHSVLLAGGIGVTPLLCMARRLRDLGCPFELIYCARSRASAAFVADIEALDVPVTWHFDDERGGPPDLRALLARRAASDTEHYYACGPAVMLDAFEKVCAELGHANAHIERFAAVEVAAAADARSTFTVELRRSGRTFEVTPDKTLHQCLIELKAGVPFSCEEGICGSCETRVLEGEPDHRDSVLTAAERAANRSMMVCVSGCRSERLVLDL